MSALESHIQTLQQKHDKIEEKIHHAFIHFQSDDAIAELKKEKLHLKDEIQELKSSNDNEAPA